MTLYRDLITICSKAGMGEIVEQSQKMTWSNTEWYKI